MKTKIVYVLTSSEHDYYLEQNLMSVYSARLHNPDACIVLVTDEQTKSTCTSGLRHDFLAYFNEVKVVAIQEYDRAKERSRFLKTTLRSIVDGDFLFIDSDTIVCEPLDDIDKQDGQLAYALDCHLQKKDWDLFFSEKSRVRGFGTTEADKHFNSGVSLVRDCPETHEFYKMWHEEWRKSERAGNSQDQPAFHATVAKLGFAITELDGTWNCQLSANFLPFLHRAKILHTFVSGNFDSPCIFKDTALLEEIRANNGLTSHVKELIAAPKEAFHPINLVMGKDSSTMVKSQLMLRAGYFYKHYRCFYNVLDRTAAALRWLCDVINYVRVHV